MNHRENFLRAARFDYPDIIPSGVHFSPAAVLYYKHEIDKLMFKHPVLFSGHKKGDYDWKKVNIDDYSNIEKTPVDSWGCRWKTLMNGIRGTAIEHPLQDWDKFALYKAPDPENFTYRDSIDWNMIKKNIIKTKEKDELTIGNLQHGFLFLYLTYIRGYENIIFDMTDEDGRLIKLIKMLEDFAEHQVRKYIDIGVDMIKYPEDLGMQNTPMLSPDQFKKYIAPSYKRLMSIARRKGALVHMHSDGYIMDLIEDIIDCGIDIINVQDLVNGIDNLAKTLRGRICIELDIDRQSIVIHGSPKDVDDHIRECVIKLGDKKGGSYVRARGLSGRAC